MSRPALSETLKLQYTKTISGLFPNAKKFTDPKDIGQKPGIKHFPVKGCCIGAAIFFLIVFFLLTAVLYYSWKAFSEQFTAAGLPTTPTPFALLKTTRSLSSQDYRSLENFLRKMENNEIHVTKEQERELINIRSRIAAAKSVDTSLAADTANALALLDPEDFSDTKHWTLVLSKILPVFKSPPALQK